MIVKPVIIVVWIPVTNQNLQLKTNSDRPTGASAQQMESIYKLLE